MSKSLSAIAGDILSGKTPPEVLDEETSNAATLKPGSKVKEPPKKLEGKVEDLGPAIVDPEASTDGPSKAANTVSKDSSKSSKAAVGSESPKKLTKEDAEADDEDMVTEEDELEEEFEIDEELEAFVAECIKEGMSEEEIHAAIDENFEFVTEESDKEDDDDDKKDDDDEDDDEKKNVKEEAELPVEVDLSKDVDALFEGEELSPEFKEKAKTIFEAAVKVRLKEYEAKLEKVFEEKLSEEVEKIAAELTEQTDKYMNYVVEQWVAENEVAIESGLRTELTEDFISGLKKLFEEHYISVPESSVDVLEEMGLKVDELESKLNEEIEKNAELLKVLNEQKKENTFNELIEGMTDVQVEKMRELAEEIEFTSEEEYAKKVKILRENYFPSTGTKSAETLEDNGGVEDGQMIVEETASPRMAAYARLLGNKFAPTN